MSLYRQGLTVRSRVGAVTPAAFNPQTVPGFNAATDLALKRMAAEGKRYFGFAFRRTEDSAGSTIQNIYHATDDVVDAADWYGSMSSGEDPAIFFATYYDTEKEPLHPVEKYLGVVNVKGGSDDRSWMAYVIGSIAAGLALIFVSKRKKKGPEAL